MFRRVECRLLPRRLDLVHGCEFCEQKIAKKHHNQVCDVHISDATLRSAPFPSCLTVIIGSHLGFARPVFVKQNDLLLLSSFLTRLISLQLLVVGHVLKVLRIVVRLNTGGTLGLKAYEGRFDKEEGERDESVNFWERNRGKLDEVCLSSRQGVVSHQHYQRNCAVGWWCPRDLKEKRGMNHTAWREHAMNGY